MSIRAERAASTRQALVTAARAHFAERGFAATSTNDVVEAAGVTRGALYHHFPTKEALFEAVYEAVENEIVGRVVEALGSVADPIGQLAAGMEAFLDACLEPAVRRIVLLEGPSVLG
ncbi:MAG: TetR/AcrR family transcriptional regulator, partial [Candidatus Binatia bacterium]